MWLHWSLWLVVMCCPLPILLDELCKGPWKKHESGACFYFSKVRQTFYEAEKSCYLLGGFLTSVRNKAEFQFITNTIQKLGPSYATQQWMIGLYQTKNDMYRWVDGSISAFRHWMPNQPNSIYERCVYLDGTNNYRWRDELCREAVYFICRREKGSMNCFEGAINDAKEELDVTATQCLEHCRAQGYHLAAVSKSKCSCFHTITGRYLKMATRKKCNLLCGGQRCGGQGLWAVYNMSHYSDLAESCDQLKEMGISKKGKYVIQEPDKESRVITCFEDDDEMESSTWQTNDDREDSERQERQLATNNNRRNKSANLSSSSSILLFVILITEFHWLQFC